MVWWILTSSVRCLNPCSRGKRRIRSKYQNSRPALSCLNPCSRGKRRIERGSERTDDRRGVLILVLEERGGSAFKSASCKNERKYVKDLNTWMTVGWRCNPVIFANVCFFQEKTKGWLRANRCLSPLNRVFKPRKAFARQNRNSSISLICENDELFNYLNVLKICALELLKNFIFSNLPSNERRKAFCEKGKYGHLPFRCVEGRWYSRK